MTDADRRRLEAALAAALLLIYAGKARQALDGLALFERTWRITPEIRQRINAFAADRAQKVHDGINQRLDASGADLPPDASPGDHQRARRTSLSEIAAYNAHVLSPFMVAWTGMQALLDVYRGTESETTPGKSRADDTQWTWEQRTSFQDECGDAASASPAPLDELLGIAGAPPPLHPRCLCTLSPGA